MNKKERNEALKREMLEAINGGGCWFCIRKDNYVKIGLDEVEGLLFARECIFKESSDGTRILEGGAYSFGLDWFDLRVGGRSIDIYADAESFQGWDIWYDRNEGTCHKTREDGREPGKRLIKFCTLADQEALAGINKYYTISSTNFSSIIK